jgi:hypothetical protein
LKTTQMTREELAALHLAGPDDLNDDNFPYLRAISAACWYSLLPHSTSASVPPEYVYVPCQPRDVKIEVAIAEWNMAWEAGVWRQRTTNWRLPAKLRWILRHEDTDLRLVPLARPSRYHVYAPLYHLLPAATARKFGYHSLRAATGLRYRRGPRRATFCHSMRRIGYPEHWHTTCGRCLLLAAFPQPSLPRSLSGSYLTLWTAGCRTSTSLRKTGCDNSAPWL